MDELGKLFQSLLGGASPDTSGDTPADDAADVSSADSAPSTQEAANDAVETNADAGMDFSGLSNLLGSFSQPTPETNQKMQLLIALKPYLRDARREKLERAQSLLSTAYSVRSILSSLGGILNV